MLDLKFVVQMLANAVQELVTATATRHFEMRGERGLRRAHGPNMQVMYRGDVWKRREIILHFFEIDAFGDGLQPKSNRLAQQSPCADRNHDDDDKAHGWINPVQSGQFNC